MIDDVATACALIDDLFDALEQMPPDLRKIINAKITHRWFALDLEAPPVTEDGGR